MSIKTSVDYSSVILNQNQAPSTSSSQIVVNDDQWRYQEFFIPSSHARGEEGFVPDLSGFQIFASVPEGLEQAISFEWVLQRRTFGVKWRTEASGRQLGVEVSGPESWVSIFFPPVDISGATEDRFRIGVRSRTPQTGRSGVASYVDGTLTIEGLTYSRKLTPGIAIEINHDGISTIVKLEDDETEVSWRTSVGLSAIWYASPNPLETQYARAVGSEGLPVVIDGSEISWNFRVLGLTAEDGIDFLGNRYRSAIRVQDVSAVDAINGNPERGWMSKPNPSRFAVESLYFDVRPTSSTPRYGQVNLIPNPVFAESGSGWSPNVSSGITVLNSGRTLIPDGSGKYGWRSNGTNTTAIDRAHGAYQTDPVSELTAVTPGQILYARLEAHAVTKTSDQRVHLQITFYDVSGNVLTNTTVVNPITDIGGQTFLMTSNPAPSGSVYARLFFSTHTAVTGTYDVYFTDIMMSTDPVDEYADGSYPSWSWTGVPFDSTSIEVLDNEPGDNVAVIDRVLIDPITPGVWCSIYYSYEGEPGTSDEEWDNRTWRRVDTSINLKEKTSYVFPEPVLAKFIKLEFTHLQPQQYSPGVFAQPVRYKKHPRWVLDYFAARVESDRRTTNQTVANKVGVVYSALDLLYNYYLDDLGQEPDSPARGSNSFDPDLLGPYEDVMDVEMLNKINTAMRPYADYAKNWDRSLLGEVGLLDTNSRIEDYPFEKATQAGLYQKTDYASLRNVGVAFESDYPVMFFYLDGSHKYRVAQSSFSHDRAYFAGIREVAFLRDQYSSTYDADLYIENGGDQFNAERSEFEYIDGKMKVPD